MSRGLAEAVDIRQHEVDVLPVLPALRGLLPAGGLRPGSVTSVRDASLLLALLAGPSAAGGWTALVGMPEYGMLAASELGLVSERLLLVDAPGARWAEVVAALLDGIQLVAVRPGGQPSPAIARRLTAVARKHGAALVVPGAWAGADLNLEVTATRWRGVHDGHGRLRERLVEVVASGRGSAGRPRTARLVLPAADGGVHVADGGVHAAPETPLTLAPPLLEEAIA